MIPALDLSRQYAALHDEIDAAIQEVLDSTAFILGPPVRSLEEEMADYCGCEHAIGLASGTDALRLALAALEIGSADEVITTPFTFVATANTISHAGARPVFVDIDPQTYSLDPAAVAAAITTRTRAIIPVHLYGQPADMEPILVLAREHNLYVIEDAAQALGARYRGCMVGTLGHIGCFSFYPTKNLGAYGDAGMVITSNAELAERLDVLRRQGGKTRYYYDAIGFNSRLDSIQAAILRVKLRYLDAWNEARRGIAQRYNELLADLPVVTPYEHPDVYHVYHQYTIRVAERDALAAALTVQGIGNAIYYPLPLHRQKLYADLGYAEDSLPHSERAAREVLSLPMFPELEPQEQERVARSIQTILQSQEA